MLYFYVMISVTTATLYFYVMLSVTTQRHSSPSELLHSTEDSNNRPGRAARHSLSPSPVGEYYKLHVSLSDIYDIYSSDDYMTCIIVRHVYVLSDDVNL